MIKTTPPLEGLDREPETPARESVGESGDAAPAVDVPVPGSVLVFVHGDDLVLKKNHMFHSVVLIG